MKKNKLYVLFLIINFSFFLLCGCSFLSWQSSGDGGADMTPRLITISKGQPIPTVIENVKSAIVGIKSSINGGFAVGSGVAIKQGGYILTNQHVISGSRGITLYFADKSTTGATIVWQDASIDLAVIKSNVDMPYLDCETEEISVGEDIIAIGTPLSLAFQHTVTKGIISALNRTVEIQSEGGYSYYMQNLIQHDASINPGNSGGPIINLSGKVVGINTLKANDAEGIGFAIPIITGETIVSRLSANNGYSAPYMGIFGVSAEFAREKDFSVGSNGLYVIDVDSNSVAGVSGVMPGDIVYRIGDSIINDFLDLRQFIYMHDIGDAVTLYINRDGELISFNIILGENKS